MTAAETGAAIGSIPLEPIRPLGAAEAADRVALRALVDTYGAALDNRDTDLMASLFLPDGTLTGFVDPGDTSPHSYYEGREELRSMAKRLAIYRRTFHFLGNHLCRIEGDEAIGIAYCLAHHLVEEDGELKDRVQILRYEDAYARMPEGWRFRSRRLHRQWTELRPIEL